MKIVFGVVALALLLGPAIGARPPQQAQDDSDAPPPWVYYVNPPDYKPTPDDGISRHVPGSAATYTITQIHDLFNVPDWHPDAHPPMPDVVAMGRKPAVRACGYCHLPNGQGRPENAGLAGLPAAYITQRMADLKNGLSKSSEPKMTPPALMIDIAKAATDDEVKSAADYFSSLKMQPWITVVETDILPKSHVSASMLVPSEPGGTEPMGLRIVEMPIDVARTELRDATAGFVAYVPNGSIERGKDLATTGMAGKTMKCSLCHGADLKGFGAVPGIAGRSPSYVFRQLYDIQHGNRNGKNDVLMKGTVAKLSVNDMIWIAAYTGSLAP